MGRSRFSRVMAIAVSACAGLTVAHDAAAWGPRARQVIAVGGLQFVRQRAPDAFRGDEMNYEADLLGGAAEGIPALGGTFPLNNDSQCVDAVSSQIQILREARRNGAGSYFAYRMGGLSALTSEILLPYGIVFNDDDRATKQIIDEYLDSRVDRFSFNAHHPVFQYILSMRLYLDKRRGFHQSDMLMIADDFKRGKGIQGMLSEAGPRYFERAVHATADVWYTVLRPEGEASDVRPSREQMAMYYIAEVRYLLEHKANMRFAERSYDLFQKYNPGMPMALVTLGDLFYEHGTPEAIERGVQEWVRAYDIPGEPRNAASKRLSKHYLDKGEALFIQAHSPKATDTDLDDAFQAFEEALRFDRSSDVAASRIHETTIAKNERRERYETQEKFIAGALEAIQMAERAAKALPEPDFAAAITSYNTALNLVNLVGGDFKDLSKSANDIRSEINKAIKTVISDVFANANEQIERGDTALANNNVDEAIKLYSMVESIVRVVPAEAGSANEVKKKEFVALADRHMEEARLQRQRLEQQQQNPAATPGLPRS